MDYEVGDMVSFKWWSPYKAPCVCTDVNGHIIWKEVLPGDIGVVIHPDDQTGTNTVVVFFSRINMMLRIHLLMLEKHITT
jgi:hypothetical protein